MNTIAVNSALAALTCLALLFSGNAFCEEKPKKKKTVYKVNFDHEKKQQESLHKIQNRINNSDTNNTNLRVVFYGKELALLLDPGLINNTRLQDNETNRFIQTEFAELKNQGLKLIVCETLADNHKSNIEHDLETIGRINTTPEARLKQLQNMGYQCTKP